MMTTDRRERYDAHHRKLYEDRLMQLQEAAQRREAMMQMARGFLAERDEPQDGLDEATPPWQGPVEGATQAGGGKAE